MAGSSTEDDPTLSVEMLLESNSIHNSSSNSSSSSNSTLESVETTTVSWESTLSKIALNIFSSRSKVVSQVLGKVAPSPANSLEQEEQQQHFDHQKVAQDIFRYSVVDTFSYFECVSIFK